MEKQTVFDFREKTNKLREENKLPKAFNPIMKQITQDRMTLSPSTLNIFTDCPRCFWLHMNLGIKRPRGAFPSIASGLDGVIKKYFDSYRSQGVLPPLLRDKIDAKLIPQLPNKLFFNDRAKNALLMGMLDECIILPGGIYAPLDYKTRRSFPDSAHPAYQLQMDVYTLLLEKNNYKTNGLAYLFYFVPDSGSLHEGIPFNVKLMEVKTSVDRAMDVFHSAIAKLREPVPDSSEDCEYCRWINERKENDKL